MMTIEHFRDRMFYLTDSWDWEVQGFVNKEGYVYPIDTDTKVISTVFERLASPVIRSICKETGYKVETANQTTYPDFTLTNIAGDRIAIDIKTTYASRSMRLTLGGYNSFLRGDTKNIKYPYSTYRDHWILGFIYEQRAAFDEYDMDNMPKVGQIPCPYLIKSLFVRRKHEISGLQAGSGNTKNIGSIIVRNPDDFADIDGPFTRFQHAKQACDHYWRQYEIFYPEQIRTVDQLLVHPEFQQFLPI